MSVGVYLSNTRCKTSDGVIVHQGLPCLQKTNGVERVKFIWAGARKFLQYCIWCATWEKALQPYANTEGPEDRAHPCSPIWTFSVCHKYYSIHWFCKRTMKALISMRERACWSGPVLSAKLHVPFFRCISFVLSEKLSLSIRSVWSESMIQRQTAKTLISLCVWAIWSESSLGAHVI